MRGTFAFLFATSFVLAGLSGCLGIGAKTNDPADDIDGGPTLDPIWEKVRGALNGTQCKVPGVSNTGTSTNIKPLGSFRQIYISILGPPTFGEIDVLGNRTAISYSNQVSFAIANFTDPLLPKAQYPYTYQSIPFFSGGNLLQPQVGSLQSHDIKFNADGGLVFLAMAEKILTFDVSDPRSIRYNYQTFQTLHPAAYRADAQVLETQTIGGAEYLFAGPGTSGLGILVHKVLGTGQYGKLEPFTVYQSPVPTPTTQPWAPADLFFDVEAKDGGNTTHLYLANGPFGIVVLGVDDPKAPRTIAQVGQVPNQAPSYFNSIDVAHIDGKRIVVTSSEGGYNTLKVWDFTDFRGPKLLGQWSIDTPPARMQHNLQIVNGTVFVSHYAEGLFGFDLREFLNNTKAGLKPSLHFQPTAGTAIDVDVEDGLIYVNDAQSVTALGFGCFPPGDKRFTAKG